MVVGLVAAFAASLCYGLGTILQASVAGESDSTAELNVARLARIVSQLRYVAGLGLDLAGFLAAVVALRTLPLFVVQSAVASSVGVTAVGARIAFGVEYQPRERLALGALLVGLVLLAAAGKPEHATRLHEPGPIILLASAMVVGGVAGVMSRSDAPWVGNALAASAGAAFGGVGIASRAVVVPRHVVSMLRDPIAYAIVLHGGVAILLFAAALQRGAVTRVAAITFAVETIVPAAIGLTLLGDHARHGFAVVALAGFAVTVGASLMLARHADPTIAMTTR